MTFLPPLLVLLFLPLPPLISHTHSSPLLPSFPPHVSPAFPPSSEGEGRVVILFPTLPFPPRPHPLLLFLLYPFLFSTHFLLHFMHLTSFPSFSLSSFLIHSSSLPFLSLSLYTNFLLIILSTFIFCSFLSLSAFPSLIPFSQALVPPLPSSLRVLMSDCDDKPM